MPVPLPSVCRLPYIYGIVLPLYCTAARESLLNAHLFRAGHKPYMALNAVLMLILAIALMALQ